MEIVPVFSEWDVRAAIDDATENNDPDAAALCRAAIRHEPGAWDRCMEMLAEARIAKIEREIDSGAGDE